MAPQQLNRRWVVRKPFSRLVRSLSQRDTRVVVSLGGGGVRMFAHAAVLAFLETLGVQQYISEIWGASGGAIIGMLYSRGQSPAEIKAEALAIFQRQHPMPRLPSRFTLTRRMNLDLFRQIHKKQGMKAYHDFQIALLKIVAKNLKENPPRCDFYCTAYNLETHDNDILTPNELPKGRFAEGIYQTDPLEAVAASSAIPIVFQPKVIEDKFGKRTYLDGAMIEEVPTLSVYKKWIRDRELGMERRRRLLLISVNLQSTFTSMGLLENPLARRLPGYEYLLLSINCADFMKAARNQAQKRILMEDPNVELWELNLEMPGSGVLNLDLIPQVLEIAEKSFPEQFAQINRSLLG